MKAILRKMMVVGGALFVHVAPALAAEHVPHVAVASAFATGYVAPLFSVVDISMRVKNFFTEDKQEHKEEYTKGSIVLHRVANVITGIRVLMTGLAFGSYKQPVVSISPLHGVAYTKKPYQIYGLGVAGLFLVEHILRTIADVEIIR